MARRFSAQVDDWVAQSEQRMTAVVLDATQRVINEAQTPVAKGGNMRVATGFLRASGSVSLTGMPAGPARGGKNGLYMWRPENVIATLKGFSIGKTIYWGWSANYARPRESKDGFLIRSVQRWQQHVNASVAALRKRTR